MSAMDLLKDDVRRARAQRKAKLPFRRALYERISGLVKQYALGESFVRKLDDVSAHLPKESLKLDALRPKEPFEPPLFSLLTEEEYRVTMEIIRKVESPYLHFVTSPDEILLCKPLFRLNPSLGPDLVARHHFETLFLAEVATREMQDVTEQVGKLRGRTDLGEHDRSQLASLEGRIRELRRFVASVTHAESR